MATEVLVPPLGANVDTVTLVTWYKREGDEVAAGEPLFAVETDKAVLDVEAPASGILQGVSVSEGDEAPCLSRIAWLAVDEDGPLPQEAAAAGASSLTTQNIAARQEPGERRLASPWARTLAAQHGVDWTAMQGSGPLGAVVARDIEAERNARSHPGRLRATPLAVRVARDAGIEIAGVAGSGPAGRVMRDDVVRAADASCAPSDVVETFSLTGIRGKIADRMLRGAQKTASVTLTAEADASAFVERRRRILATGLRVTYNDLLMEIVARALTVHPRLNATYEGDQAVVRCDANIALAVDTDRGLVAPVVKGVQTMSLARIAAATSSLVERARSGQITPDELRGSTFTITNLGMFGIDAFTPIINTPECAILGVGRIKPTPWVVGDCIGIRQAMWLSLTFDHRLVDGGPAARFLQAIVKEIESPGPGA